jgi:adenylyl-sulfate kinase
MLFPNAAGVTAARHFELKGHAACVVWLTGLSGAGKTTLALALQEQLHSLGVHTAVLDGDNLRCGLNSDLGFSQSDRTTNVLRTAHVCKLMVEAGLVVIASLISPQREQRALAQSLLPQGQFFEVYVHAPLDVCEQRDTKGLYAKARKGAILNFTGIGADYEPPLQPHLLLNTENENVEECLVRLLQMLQPLLHRTQGNS